MFLDVGILEKRKIPFDQFFRPGSIDFPDADLKQAGDLHVTGVAELIDPFGVREIRIRGDIRGDVEVLCARCLDPVRVHVSRPMDLFYRPMADIARDEEVEISKAELEVGFYEGKGIELADVVREQIVIDLPMRSVCREECLGICPVCGRNRNFEACSCRSSFNDTRWDVLRDWKH